MAFGNPILFRRRISAAAKTTFALLFALICAAGIHSAGAAPLAPGAAFLNREINSGDGDIQVDSAGGQHVAYASESNSEDDEIARAYYAYCAPGANCSNAANWTQTTLGAGVEEVQIQLTPQDQPRLLLQMEDEDPESSELYVTWRYAECNTNCTTAASWTIIFIGGGGIDTVDFNSPDTSNHYFELDAQGRPRAVFGPNVEMDPETFELTWYMVYAACDMACTATQGTDPITGKPIPTNWTYGRILAEFDQPALALTSTSQPRIAAFIETDSGEDVLVYYSCDTACNESANWAGATIGEPSYGGELAVSLRVDSQNRPRLVTYIGDQGSLYMWCNSNCLVPAQWGTKIVHPETQNGGDPDLQIDDQNRPRIAFHWVDATDADNPMVGLGYAWCDTNCESAQGDFEYSLVEATVELDEDWVVPPPTGCQFGNWNAAFQPALALDAAGNPHVVYGAAFLASGCPGQIVTRAAVRYFAFLHQPVPPVLLENPVFLPTIGNPD